MDLLLDTHAFLWFYQADRQRKKLFRPTWEDCLRSVK
jgi:PIN domain nuclease of toxin-antitoxin system